MNDDRRDNFVLGYAATEPPLLAEGEQCHFRFDPADNALIVKGTSPSIATAATPYYSPLANLGQIKATPGVVYITAGRYMGAVLGYFMLFNKVAALALNDAPMWPSMPLVQLAGGFPFGLSYPGGLKFTNGLRWAISSTPELYTAVAGATLALGATFI